MIQGICKQFRQITYFLARFRPILVKNVRNISDISFGSTFVSFKFFNEVGIKLFLFLIDAIDFIPCQILRTIRFVLFKVITIVFLVRKMIFFNMVSNLFKEYIDFRFDN